MQQTDFPLTGIPSLPSSLVYLGATEFWKNNILDQQAGYQIDMHSGSL